MNLIPQSQNPRKIKYIVLHCTAGPQTQTIAAIQAYWRNNLGWKSPGYHIIIQPDGTPVQLLTLDKISNGVANYNTPSIHISYIGGIDAAGKPIDNRTDQQKATQIKLLDELKKGYPNAVVLGHRDFSTDKNGNGILEVWEWIKSCPSFDVREWIASMKLEAVAKPNGIIYKLNYPLIKDGKVKEIQQALNATGIIQPKLEVDGIFGADTDAAVKAFQDYMGLDGDGVVCKKTATFLKIVV